MIKNISFEDFHENLEKLNLEFREENYEKVFKTFIEDYLGIALSNKFDDFLFKECFANAVKSSIKSYEDLNTVLLLNSYIYASLNNNNCIQEISILEIFASKNDNKLGIINVRSDISLLLDNFIDIKKLDRYDTRRKYSRSNYVGNLLSRKKIFFAYMMKKNEISDDFILSIFGIFEKVVIDIFDNNKERAIAFLLDDFVPFSFMLFLLFFSDNIYYFVILFLILWLRYIIAECVKQATFGKKFLKLKVVTIEAEHISIGQASIRYIGKILNFLLFRYLILFFNKDKISFSDMIANKTLVVKDKYVPAYIKRRISAGGGSKDSGGGGGCGGGGCGDGGGE